MKTIKFLMLSIVALTISTIFCACDSDDDLPPITIRDTDNTAIKLIYPNTYPIGYTIEGGDGNYSVTSDNPEIVLPKIIQVTDASATDMNLSLEAKGLGTAKVTITDKSQNLLTLVVVVDYMTMYFIIEKHDIQITGNELTDKEKKAISDNILPRFL